MGDFRGLQVWRRGHQLTLDVYRVSAGFPREELFGLTSQMRRSCSSISANIAEGCGRNSDAELARFLRIALGSANELDYHLLLARDLHYLTELDHDRLSRELIELRNMMSNFIERLAGISQGRS